MNILDYKKELLCLSEIMKFTVPGCPLLRNLIKNVKCVRIPLSETRSSQLLTLYLVKAEKAVVARSGQTELPVPFAFNQV